MAIYNRNFFSIKQPLYVRKPFKANGRLFTKDTLFDWKVWAITSKRVEQLFRASYLTHDTPDKVIEIANPVAEDQDNSKKELKKEPEVQEVKEYKLQHKSGPYYNVIDESGAVMNEKGLQKAKALELLEELQGKTDEEKESIEGDSGE